MTLRRITTSSSWPVRAGLLSAFVVGIAGGVFAASCGTDASTTLPYRLQAAMCNGNQNCALNACTCPGGTACNPTNNQCENLCVPNQNCGNAACTCTAGNWC